MTTLDSLATEYRTITEGCGLVDRTERGKLALTGTEVKSFLQGQVSNDTESLTEGHGCYAAFLTPKGKMLGDLRILDAGQEVLLDTERVALQELFNMIRRFSIGYAVELHKRTLESGLLSLVGPQSDAVTRAAFGAVPGSAEHEHLAAGAVRLIRTDVGIDVLFDAASTERVREAASDAGAEPVSEAAAECLRIEHGRPRYGIDLDDSVIPQEAGLNERAVSFTKGCYVGQETVARLFYRGKPNRYLRGLRSEEPLEPGTELRYEDRVAGRVTSVAVSPRFGPIALAFVRREVPVGATMNDGEAAAAEVVELPFA
ncbi:MAG TPA: glycine cleavage T C-terminal barrel domain-containing protein [Solirubrobacteraceae bacterium]|nr:glycine cleavage T C-terminal barrel domain-containing protein [Solirubrobacteraceae bacterium]